MEDPTPQADIPFILDHLEAEYCKTLGDDDTPILVGFLSFARTYLDENRTAEFSPGDRNWILKLTNNVSVAVHPDPDQASGDMEPSSSVRVM